jgi:hypothetical protein
VSSRERAERRRAAKAAAKAQRPHLEQKRTQPPDWFRSAIDALARGLTDWTWHYHDGSDDPQAIPCAHFQGVPSNFPDTIISLDQAVCRECGAVSGAALDEPGEGHTVRREWWWAGAGPPVIVPTKGKPDDLLLESHCPVPEHGIGGELKVVTSVAPAGAQPFWQPTIESWSSIVGGCA